MTYFREPVVQPPYYGVPDPDPPPPFCGKMTVQMTADLYETLVRCAALRGRTPEAQALLVLCEWAHVAAPVVRFDCACPRCGAISSAWASECQACALEKEPR